MTTLTELAPTENSRLMDLLEEAGVDVSDWANFAKGPRHAAANPKYCYEWSFLQPARVVVLTVWHYHMGQDSDGMIFTNNNMRANAKKADAPSAFRNRALRYDEHLRAARSGNLPIRVIIGGGAMRGVNLPASEASKVKSRHLDSVPWSIRSYNDETGDYVLQRGAVVVRFVDQFSVLPVNLQQPERREVNGLAFVRSSQVRLRVLVRANGRCEWCGEPGFATDDGRIYLETHHVVSLADNGADMECNVVALCPNHHREAHYGSQRAEMRDGLIRRAAAKEE